MKVLKNLTGILEEGREKGQDFSFTGASKVAPNLKTEIQWPYEYSWPKKKPELGTTEALINFLNGKNLKGDAKTMMTSIKSKGPQNPIIGISRDANNTVDNRLLGPDIQSVKGWVYLFKPNTINTERVPTDKILDPKLSFGSDPKLNTLFTFVVDAELNTYFTSQAAQNKNQQVDLKAEANKIRVNTLTTPVNKYNTWYESDGGPWKVFGSPTVKALETISKLTVVNGVGDKDKIVYTTEKPHGYTPGMEVTVESAAPTGYNVANQRIIAADERTFTIANFDKRAFDNTTYPFKQSSPPTAKSSVKPELNLIAPGVTVFWSLLNGLPPQVGKKVSGYTTDPTAKLYKYTSELKAAIESLINEGKKWDANGLSVDTNVLTPNLYTKMFQAAIIVGLNNKEIDIAFNTSSGHTSSETYYKGFREALAEANLIKNYREDRSSSSGASGGTAKDGTSVNDEADLANLVSGLLWLKQTKNKVTVTPLDSVEAVKQFWSKLPGLDDKSVDDWSKMVASLPWKKGVSVTGKDKSFKVVQYFAIETTGAYGDKTAAAFKNGYEKSQIK